MSNCDQVFYLGNHTAFHAQPYRTHVWRGYAARTGVGGFAGVVPQLISDGTITEPGPYCIVRVDPPGAAPILCWVGIVQDDMTVIDGIEMPTPISTPVNISTWPPR